MSSTLVLKEYSPKSFVVRGDSRPYKEQLKTLGGKWNPRLKDGAGWIFGNTRLNSVKDFIKLNCKDSDKTDKVSAKTDKVLNCMDSYNSKPFITRLFLLKEIASMTGVKRLYKGWSNDDLLQRLEVLHEYGM